MSNLKILGQITYIGETQEFGKSKYRKTEVRINSGTQDVPNVISLWACGKRADIPAAFSVGDSVEIAFWVNGREWDGKVYNELSIEIISSVAKKPVEKAEEKTKEVQLTGDDPKKWAEQISAISDAHQDKVEELPF